MIVIVVGFDISDGHGGIVHQTETITITGSVRTNRDFGAGYSYPVIVEDAKIVRK